MSGRAKLAEYLRKLADEAAFIEKRVSTFENNLQKIADELDKTEPTEERSAEA